MMPTSTDIISIPVLGVTTAEAAVAGLANAIATGVCKTAQESCNATNTAAKDLYQSPEQCHEFLTQKIRFGKAYELGRNTLLCRAIHQNMVTRRPSEHW